MAKSNKTELGQSIIKGLKEALAYEKGNTLKGVRVKNINIRPIPKFSKYDIKNIREKMQMSQKSFALLLGVSLKTIEAWENGRNHANGTAQRMLYLLKIDSQLPEKYSLVG